ncbi:hypothetical protein GCM10025865_23230 [Paraoerskovia sediminicola]|uniref:5-oxoprolinase subunit A n=1 Tax=Paraoerskovia sediminicola TaxID=1138587 RepID=A0ABN6XDV4_9CELL|nr:hypothetical protein GCM10025865_23230 [Paraoerskovia sediminicola]
MSHRIDLNCDLGEGFGPWTIADDDALLDLVTSANVACGFHAGDSSTMRRVTAAAASRGVAIGAHVGYRDLAGFGRRFVDVAPDVLFDEVVHQISALQGFARLAGSRVSYVKPHGALYNAIVHHEAQAKAVVDAVAAVDDRLPVVGLAGSAVLRLAEASGLPVVHEVFADRGYRSDGTLVPRGTPGDVLHGTGLVADRVVRMVQQGTVLSADGTVVPVEVDSVCVHSDTPGAVELLGAVRGRSRARALTSSRSWVSCPDSGPGRCSRLARGRLSGWSRGWCRVWILVMLTWAACLRRVLGVRGGAGGNVRGGVRGAAGAGVVVVTAEGFGVGREGV